VVVADIDAEAANSTASSISSGQGKAIAAKADVTNDGSIAAMIEKTVGVYGRIDILVNNAGARYIKGFLEHTKADWDAMLSINLTGPFLCSQAVVPHMLAAGKGKIINLASIASFMGRPNRCAYVAAKAGVLGLTRAMAADMAGRNILVNAIAPGMIASPFNREFAVDDNTGPAWAQENLVGRWGQPEDIAGAAVFLASDESDFINGSEIKIEGGWLGARSRSGEVPI
jgi:NAD(P)-dependent dehydrogenase (short-subunit alcohol dehydrogenase family)